MRLGPILVAGCLLAGCGSSGDEDSGSVEAFCDLVEDPPAVDSQSFYLDLKEVAPAEVRDAVSRRAALNGGDAEILAFAQATCAGVVDLP